MNLSSCCTEMQNALDREFLENGPIHRLPAGRILNEIDSEYFLRNVEMERRSVPGGHRPALYTPPL